MTCGRSQISISTLLIAILGIAAVLALPLETTRSSPAWSLPVSTFAMTVSLLFPGAIVAMRNRACLDEMVAQIALTASFWNLVLWLPVPAYRVIVLVGVPCLVLIVTTFLGRAMRQGRNREQDRMALGFSQTPMH
jgi:hypothetical protein